MGTIRLGPFLGAYRAPHPKLLPDHVGTISENHWPERGDLRPWRVPLAHTTIGASKKTIVMLGRDATSDTIYWLEWTTVVHAVRSFRADDTTKRTYYTGSGPPKVTDNILALAGAPFPTSYRDLGIPKPAGTPILTETTPGTGEDEDRFYALTYISDWSEEGPPVVFGPVTCKPGAEFDITSIPAPPSGPGETRGITNMRLYRTVVGENSGSFFLLSDVPTATSTTDAALTPTTTLLESALYYPPPTDLKNLLTLWNGMMAGISGKSVRYCEIFKPHAWPAPYETLCTDTPVALGAYQQNLVILTTGKPRLVSGTSPEAMDDVPIEFIAACVSAQSVVSFGHGVCWATSDGLAYVGSAGAPRLLTADAMTLDDWQALVPSTIIGCQHAGLYFGFYNDGAGLKGFFLDPLRPEGGIHFLTAGYAAAFFDELSEQMYVLNGTSVQKWNAGASNMTARHRTKVYRLPSPDQMLVAKVIADTFPVTFTLIREGKTNWVKSVANKWGFVMPGGLVDNYQIEISTTGAVQGVVFAGHMEELKQS